MFKTKRMIFRLVVLAIICIWNCHFALAQPMRVTELPTQGQLPVAHIHRMLQDREGYMWYGTEGGGLCRDDGYRIEVFRATPQVPDLLASNTITCLAEDNQQRIWFGTEKGLYVLDKKNYQVSQYVPGGNPFAGKRVDALCVANDGTVWASARAHIFHLSPDGDVLGRYASVWHGKPVTVADFYESRDGTLWVLQWEGGLSRYDVSTDSIRPCLWNCDAFPCQMTECGRDGDYWVATWGKGVVRYDPRTGVRLQPCTYTDKSQPGHKALVLGLLPDNSRQILWVVAMDDLYAYAVAADGTLTPQELSGFLPRGKKILDRALKDKWGNIWIPGYSPHTFILSSHTNRMRRDGVEAMTNLTGYPVMVDRLVADRDFYWIWQGRTGLSIYDPAAGKMAMANEPETFPGAMPIHKCIEKCRGKDGIWASSGERVIRLWREGKSVVRMEEVARVAAGEQVCVLFDDGNGVLWMGTGESLYRYDERGGVLLVFSGQGAVRDITRAPDGTVYVLTAKGLAKVGKNMFCKEIAPGADYTVADVAADGKVYVGASSGYVYVYDPEKRSFHVEENAGNRNGDAVKSLAIDRLGHVWVLSDQYVKEYNPANGSFYLLRNSDAEIDMDYFHTVCQVGDSICIGGIGAFCMVAPSVELDKSAQPVMPVVSAYSVNGETHFVGASVECIEIQPGQNVLVLSFSTLDHLHARQINFAYRLKGQGDWIYLPAGTNTVSLAHLPTGNYAVEVMATDMHGCWGKPVECLALRKLPFWYETWWARTLFVLAAMYLAVAVVRTYLNRTKKKQQEEMEWQLTQMKFRFFTNVSHELRTPLTLIITPLEHLMETVGDKQVILGLQSVYYHACEMQELVNHLLDFRKLETGAEKLYLLNGDMAEFVRTVCEAFKPLAESRSVSFLLELSEESLFMCFDRDKIHRVLYNLLGNAFKFTPQGGVVEAQSGLMENGKTFFFEVRDNGCGIAAEDLPKVFDRYFQAKDGTVEGGSGIGLYLVKTYIEMHGGHVEVNSKKGEGSTFRIYLPTNLEKETVPRKNPAENALVPIPTSSGEDVRKCLLVAEDNAELRGFLVKALAADYDVHEAANGEEAETVIRACGAEVVVTDVKMPVMDGLELCRRLKRDVRTSHIFVILLSAYGQDAERLAGYEAGADCYLTKPFNMNILRNRIRHFFDLQDRRKKIFLSTKEFSASDIAPTKMDEVFLGKAADCVETHLDDASYSVERFSCDMCMSRMNLYRKLQSLTGQTPSEFVRAIRLKKGAQMLASGIPTVAEVADRVGFSTPSYFSKCFKEMFGVLPTQYKG